MGLLYTKMKAFHFKEKLDSLPLSIDKIMAPIHIRIKPTNICCHSCWYCAYRADNLQVGKNMLERDFIPKEKMMEIIDDIIEMGVQAVTFSGGGDPFCYPYLSDAVAKLSNSSVKFASLTNGSLLFGKTAEIFAHNAQWVRISMDGWDDKSYSKYRKVPVGEFTKTLINIKDFKKYKGKCYLGVSLICDKNNSSHIYELVKKLKDSGVNSVKIAPCIVHDNRKENSKYHKPIFNKVKEQIAIARKELGDNGFEIFDSYHNQLESFRKEYEWCPYLQILPIIGADLNVYPCQDKAYNLKDGLIGSIKNKRFKDFWFEDKRKFFKIDPSKVCNHHCVTNEKNKIIMEYLNVDKEHLGFV